MRSTECPLVITEVPKDYQQNVKQRLSTGESDQIDSHATCISSYQLLDVHYKLIAWVARRSRN